jgi:hypothetical protein
MLQCKYLALFITLNLQLFYEAEFTLCRVSVIKFKYCFLLGHAENVSKKRGVIFLKKQENKNVPQKITVNL